MLPTWQDTACLSTWRVERGEVLRIISVRRAERREVKHYVENI